MLTIPFKILFKEKPKSADFEFSNNFELSDWLKVQAPIRIATYFFKVETNSGYSTNNDEYPQRKHTKFW